MSNNPIPTRHPPPIHVPDTNLPPPYLPPNSPQYILRTPSPEIEELGEASNYNNGMHSHHGSSNPPRQEPHVHPEPGWSLNHDRTWVLYDVRLSVGQEGLEVPAFIQYDFDTNDPELLTRGWGCTVHLQPLHTQPHPRPYPATAPTHREWVSPAPGMRLACMPHGSG
jgi:hypothetical protein